MNDFLDQTYEPQPAKRPVFLTVLCILTFVGTGLGFISGLFNLLTANATERNMQNMMRMQQSMGTDDNMPELFESMSGGMAELSKWTTFGAYMTLGNAVICLAGALLMWKLRKAGFYIYTFGQILPFITLFGMFSAIQDVPLLGLGVLIGGIVSAIFAIGFIIMYGVNLKHMR